MNKPLLCVLVLLALVTAAAAQENMGARPISMGGAFTGLADDPNAIFVNPAGLGYLRGEQALVSTKVTSNSNYTIVAGVEETVLGNIGIGYAGATSTLSNNGEVLDQSLVISYARALNNFMVVPDYMGQLLVGANVRFTSAKVTDGQGFSRDDGSTAKIDLAAIFKPNEHLSYGVNFKDLLGGEFMASANNGAAQPQIAVGVAGNLLDKSLIWTAEQNSLGCEWKPVAGLALRAGRDGEYNTAGFGVNYEGMSFDYALMDKDEPIHYLSVAIEVRRSRVTLSQAAEGMERASF